MDFSPEFIKTNLFGNSYARMVVAVVILIATVLIKMGFVRIFNRYIDKSSLELNNDPTNYKFLRHAGAALIYIVGFILAIYTVPAFRSLAHSMLAGAGILAVAIGFASQQAFSNIISGLFIVIFKPFRVNDRLILQSNITGVVEDITLRHTVIRNYENRRVIIPNAVISQETLVNSDIVEEKICKIMDIGVDYTADLDKVRKIIQEEGLKHRFFMDNRKPEQLTKEEHPVAVRVMGWGDSSINIRIWVWAINSTNAFEMGCELYEILKKRFDQEGIGIPFPHRTIVYKNEESPQLNSPKT